MRTNHFPRVEGLVLRHRFDDPIDFGPRQAAVARGRAEHPRLVSTFEGRIQELLLALPSYASKEPLASLFQGLLTELRAGLGEDAQLTVAVHRDIAETAEGWIKGVGFVNVAVVPVDDTVNFSVWAEDAYVSVFDDQSRDSVYLVEPPAFGRYADALLADFFVGSTDKLSTYQVPLYFQGGNVLVGDDFFMIGIDYPKRTLDEMFVPSGDDPLAEVREEYRKHLDLDRRLLFVGTEAPINVPEPKPFDADGAGGIEVFGGGAGTFQPIFHIDMFVTLVGRVDDGPFRVMVGDPMRASKLLAEELPSHANASAFDEVADRLAAAGFEVTRNPLPYTSYDEWDEENRVWVRTWYFATSNNALVEVAGEARQVWLPTYGYGPWEHLKRTDDANAEAWTDLGFTVRQLPDFHPLAQWSGAVHCVKKYVRREAA
jgi:hypothetical protein